MAAEEMREGKATDILQPPQKKPPSSVAVVVVEQGIAFPYSALDLWHPGAYCRSGLD